MKKAAVVFAISFTSLMLLLAARQKDSAPVRIPEHAAAFLIRFGNDGAADVDWSGSLSAPGARISGWQFNTPDAISGNSWKCSTRTETYWDTPYERNMHQTSHRDKVTAKGILVEFDDAGTLRVQVVTKQGEFLFNTDLTIGDSPRLFLDGRASVTAVPASTPLTNGPEAEDYPSLVEAKDGTLWLAYQSYDEGKGDQIFVCRRSGDVWSEPEPLADAGGDYFRTAIAQDGSGRVWVIWSAEVDSNYDLYARSYDGKRWSSTQRLTTAVNSDIFHVLVSDKAGNLYLAYQSARSGNFDIYLQVFNGKRWSREIQVSTDSANDWEPALAVGPNGTVMILWDTYAKGNYDVVSRTYSKGELGPIVPIAESGAFESRASATYDRQGRLWIAWDQGDWNWAKDYGDRIPESGRGILTRRQVRVAVFENGRLLETTDSIGNAVPEDLRQVFHHPTILLDAGGNPWVFFRTRVNLPQQRETSEERTPYRAMWRLDATTYRQGRWSPMVEFPDGYGRIDMPLSSVLQRDGKLAVVWVTDGRTWPTGRPAQQDLRFAAIGPSPTSAEIALAPFVPSAENLPLSHPHETTDIQRVRSFRTEVGGQSLRIIRGDLHRHTDFSWDGNRDGSLDDSYRYALDAASLDFLGATDHQGGELIPYNWWRLQKAVDLYTIKDRFTPLYSYERSVKWPNGHRNVLFDHRGPPILEIPPEEASGQVGAGRLYAYLQENNGIATSHTSAEGDGTDWRDSNGELEPVVEIYQGYRSLNFEGPGTPRSPGTQQSQKYAAGFVWSAWAKGIKLGVQSSSDHVSTHISYAGLFVDALNRQSIIAALKARRSYAATDNIFIETRMADHFMGESFKAPAPSPLMVHVSGTAPLAQIVVIKNKIVVYSLSDQEPEVRFTYLDNDAKSGESYYYVRVQQADGQLCWSSPIWVQYP